MDEKPINVIHRFMVFREPTVGVKVGDLAFEPYAFVEHGMSLMRVSFVLLAMMPSCHSGHRAPSPTESVGSDRNLDVFQRHELTVIAADVRREATGKVFSKAELEMVIAYRDEYRAKQAKP